MLLEYFSYRLNSRFLPNRDNRRRHYLADRAVSRPEIVEELRSQILALGEHFEPPGSGWRASVHFPPDEITLGEHSDRRTVGVDNGNGANVIVEHSFATARTGVSGLTEKTSLVITSLAFIGGSQTFVIDILRLVEATRGRCALVAAITHCLVQYRNDPYQFRSPIADILREL